MPSISGRSTDISEYTMAFLVILLSIISVRVWNEEEKNEGVRRAVSQLMPDLIIAPVTPALA